MMETRLGVCPSLRLVSVNPSSFGWVVRNGKNMTTTEKKKLYGLLKEILALKYGDKCLRCKKPEWQMSHIYPRGRYKRMEHEPENILPLCSGCHIFFWHKNPIEAHEWLKLAIPKEQLQRLKLMANTYMGKFDPKFQILFLEKMLTQLQKKYVRNN